MNRPFLTRVLLVEDNPVDRLLTQRLLTAGSGGSGVQVSVAASLAAATTLAGSSAVDAVLLDLNLPDSAGLETFSQLAAAAPNLPVVVLTGTDDESLALEAVRLGAQDYLVKGSLSSGLVQRAVRYAIERSRLQQELRALSLMDGLTGLHNLRGFQTLASEDIRLATRRGTGLVIGFADLDGLKLVNDTLGHAEGDAAIRGAAQVLMAAFRSTDLIARVGGDEFALLIRDAEVDGIPVLRERLAEQLAAENARTAHSYPLMLSAGFVYRSPSDLDGLDQLLAEADRRMYLDKTSRRAARPVAAR